MMQKAVITAVFAVLGGTLLPQAEATTGNGGVSTGVDGPVGHVGNAPRGKAGYKKGRGKPLRPPLVALFKVSPTRITRAGERVTVRYRVNWQFKRVRLKLAVYRGREAVQVKKLGMKKTGVAHRLNLPNSDWTAGSYRVVLSAQTRSGKRLRLRRRANVKRTATVSFVSHFFPIDGPFNWSGDGGRFGAPRPGRTHRGYDIIATEGTRVVAPTSGTISYRSYQAGGAGYYLVLNAAAENHDYVFMHLQKGSLRVNVGDSVGSGQWIANVGNTGYSMGAHLHFEIWRGTWYNGGEAIDPLPFLRRWAGASRAQQAGALTATAAPLD